MARTEGPTPRETTSPEQRGRMCFDLQQSAFERMRNHPAYLEALDAQFSGRKPKNNDVRTIEFSTAPGTTIKVRHWDEKVRFHHGDRVRYQMTINGSVTDSAGVVGVNPTLHIETVYEQDEDGNPSSFHDGNIEFQVDKKNITPEADRENYSKLASHANQLLETLSL